MRIPKWIFVAAPVGFAVFIGIGGTVVMLLWNWLGPALFGLRQVSFWQALGLLMLCRILFGGFGLRGGGGRRSGHRRRMRERWEQMSPEEVERISQSWKGKWGFCSSMGSGDGKESNERNENKESR